MPLVLVIFHDSKMIFFPLLWVHTALLSQPYLWAPTTLRIAWAWCHLLTSLGTWLDCKPQEYWKGVLPSYEFLIPNIICGTFMLSSVNICWVKLYMALLVWQSSCKLRTMPLNREILQGTHHFSSVYHNAYLNKALLIVATKRMIVERRKDFHWEMKRPFGDIKYDLDQIRYGTKSGVNNYFLQRASSKYFRLTGFTVCCNYSVLLLSHKSRHRQ